MVPAHRKPDPACVVHPFSNDEPKKKQSCLAKFNPGIKSQREVTPADEARELTRGPCLNWAMVGDT